MNTGDRCNKAIVDKLQRHYLVFGAVARGTPDSQIECRQLLFMHNTMVDERHLCQLPIAFRGQPAKTSMACAM